MALFRYRAYDRTGKKTRGRIEAETEAHAVRKLKQSGLYVEDVRRSNQRSGIQIGQGRTKKDLAMAMTQLASLVGSNMQLVDALDALSASESNPRLASAFSDLSSAIRSGSTLGDAMAGMPQLFDHTAVSMVRSSESAGNLDQILRRLADAMNRRREVASKLLSALAYPSAVLLVGIAVVVFMLTSVVPMVTQVFEGARAELPGITVLVLAMSDLVSSWGWLMLLGALGFSALWMLALRRSRALRLRSARVLLRLPALGPLLMKTSMARFCGSLAAMLAGGVPLIRAMEQSAAVCGNLYLEQAVRDAAAEVVKGANVDAALSATGAMPELVVNMIATGRRAGTLPEMLEHLSTMYQAETIRAVDAFLAVVEPVMILLIGGMVAVIMAATLLPIFELNTLIQ